jgi:hypothetical protein
MVSLTMMEIFSTPDNPSLLHYGTYTPSLVILSILVAIFSSWMGLQVAAQARRGTRGLRAAMLATGSLALGCGVWSMHFIGMLAFDLCIDVDYDHGLTLLSVLPSLAASWVALTIISRRRVTGSRCGGRRAGGRRHRRHALHRHGRHADGAGAALRPVHVRPVDRGGGGAGHAGAVDPLWPAHAAPAARRAGRDQRQRDGLRHRRHALHRHGGGALRRHLPLDASPQTNSTFLALAITLITVAFTVFVMAANGLLRYRDMYRQQAESQAWMRALLTTTIDGVITVDRTGVIHEFNLSAERIFGWPAMKSSAAISAS